MSEDDAQTKGAKSLGGFKVPGPGYCYTSQLISHYNKGIQSAFKLRYTFLNKAAIAVIKGSHSF